MSFIKMLIIGISEKFGLCNLHKSESRTLKKCIKCLFDDGIDVQKKIINNMLIAVFIGGVFALMITFLMGSNNESIPNIAALVCLVGISMWIVNCKNNPELAAIIITIGANIILFPMMYFFAGGINSAMPMWMMLGMILEFIMLKGKRCIIIFLLNVAVFTLCLLTEYFYPQTVHSLGSQLLLILDIIQSTVIISCVFGIIFKYQAYVYESQKKKIEKRDEELLETLEELKIANMAKSDFLASMSHEIRTPINSIFGHTEMIMRESNESQIVEYAENIQSAGKGLLSIVNDVIDYTNIENGNLKLEKSTYSVLSLIHDIVSYERINAESKNLDFRVNIDENLPQKLEGDSVRLIQIFDNLVSNGVKYTKRGFVELNINWKGENDNFGFMQVSVKDSGIGIKEENIKKMSESFVRFDKTRTRNIKGLGLGLAIVFRLLKLMDSTLEVESEYGVGSIFSFSVRQKIVSNVPVGKVKLEKRTAQRAKLFDFTTKNVKIIYVDDNEVNLGLFKGMLKGTDIYTDVALNGKECLKLLENNDYDIIFLDHMMPVMDGVETLKSIRKIDKWKNTPVIVITANAISGAREEYLKDGFDDYCSKPVLAKDLEKILRKFIPDKIVENTEDKPVNISLPATALIGKLDFLDTTMGLSYCADSEEFYGEILETYLESNKLESINKYYNDEDWDNYRIQVHSLKSTSLSIGAPVLSEEAKKLEFSAKNGEIDYIKENNGRVMEMYKELMDKLRKVISPTEKEIEEMHKENADDRYCILVVDDEIMNLRIADKMLGELFRITFAKSGAEALECLEKEIPDLMLLDIHMIDMNGFEVMNIIKNNKKYAEIPIILLTADTDREIEVKGFREGAIDFISKPFVADIAIQRIKRVIELANFQKNLKSQVEKQVKEVMDKRKQFEQLSMQMVIALVGTIDAKDKYTNGHSIRVAEYSKEIAIRYGCSYEEQENIYYAAVLHDIGKIGIPDGIINKTSRLTDEEYAIIKKHPEIGADILKNIVAMPDIAVGARWHHERIDGKGYPDGLKGDEIPFVARIICVADAYDAMTSGRSYRDPLPQSVVRAEIEKGKNTQFDPVLADIMLKMIDEDVNYVMRQV